MTGVFDDDGDGDGRVLCGRVANPPRVRKRGVNVFGRTGFSGDFDLRQVARFAGSVCDCRSHARADDGQIARRNADVLAHRVDAAHQFSICVVDLSDQMRRPFRAAVSDGRRCDRQLKRRDENIALTDAHVERVAGKPALQSGTARVEAATPFGVGNQAGVVARQINAGFLAQAKTAHRVG